MQEIIDFVLLFELFSIIGCGVGFLMSSVGEGKFFSRDLFFIILLFFITVLMLSFFNLSEQEMMEVKVIFFGFFVAALTGLCVGIPQKWPMKDAV